MHWTQRFVGVALFGAGVALTVHAGSQSGWTQAWQLQVGSSIALLGPFIYLEEYLTREISGRVSTEVARQLRDYADLYRRLRELLPPGPDRTTAFERLSREVMEEAQAGRIKRADVAAAVDDGATRVIALAAMAGDPTLIDDGLLRRAIEESEAAYEMYWAFLVATTQWNRLSRAMQHWLFGLARDPGSRPRTIAAGDREIQALADSVVRLGHTEGLS